MALMSEIVEAALHEVGIVSDTRVATADQASKGLRALNLMLHGWNLRGVKILVPTVADPEETEAFSSLGASDEFPIGPEFEEGTIYNLATRLSSKYRVPVGFDPDDWFRGIQAAYMIIDEAEMPEALTRLPSQEPWRYSI